MSIQVIIESFLKEILHLEEGKILYEVVYDALFIVCILVILAVLLLVARKVLHTMIYKNKKWSEKQKITLFTAIFKAIKYVIYFIGAIQIINLFIDNTPILVALTSIGGIAIGFGAQSIVKDVVTGLFFLVENQFSIGDEVEIGGQVGKVEDIGLRTTRIRNMDGRVHIFPNGSILSVTNATKGYSRCIVEVSTPYTNETSTHISKIENTVKELKDIDSRILALNGVDFVRMENENAIYRIVVDTKTGINFDVALTTKQYIQELLEKEKIQNTITIL